MRELPTPEKAFYSLTEVAQLTGRPPGMIRRWVYRRQLDCIWLEEGIPYIPLGALRERLSRPHRVERDLRGRRIGLRLEPGGDAD